MILPAKGLLVVAYLNFRMPYLQIKILPTLHLKLYCFPYRQSHFVSFHSVSSNKSNTNQTPILEESPYHRLSSSIGVYVFKINADTHTFQVAQSNQCIYSIASKSRNRFRDNHINFTRLAIFDHLFKRWSLGLRCASNTFICINFNQGPILTPINHLCIVILLSLDTR